MFASPSWEKQIKPSVIAVKSEATQCNINHDRNKTLLCVDEAATATWGRAEEKGMTCTSPPGPIAFTFRLLGRRLRFYSNRRILVALPLLEWRRSGIASLASWPLDEAVESIDNRGLCQIALLHCSGLAAESHDSHRASWVEQWSTGLVLHLNYKWTSNLCSAVDWKSRVPSSIA